MFGLDAIASAVVLVYCACIRALVLTYVAAVLPESARPWR